MVLIQIEYKQILIIKLIPILIIVGRINQSDSHLILESVNSTNIKDKLDKIQKVIKYH